MHIVVTMHLNEVKTIDKLTPLLQCELVDKVTLVRHTGINLESKKLVQVNYDKATGPWSTQRMIRNTILNFWNVFRISWQEKPDTTLAYFLTPYGLIAWLVARLTGCLVIVSLIGTDFDKRLKVPVLNKLLYIVLRNSDGVIIFGEAAREQLISKGLHQSRVFVLPNTINSTTYCPDPTIQPDKDLIFVGNLLSDKRVDLILHAMQKVKEHRPQTTLLIVGDGRERSHLEQLSSSLDISDMVEFYGNSDQVVDQLRRSKIFIMLSDHEGLPAALIEAMCTGLPAIVTSVGSIASVVVEGQNGYLLDAPADTDKVAEHILTILDNPPHYASLRESATQIRYNYGYERGAQIWSNVLSILSLRSNKAS